MPRRRGSSLAQRIPPLHQTGVVTRLAGQFTSRYTKRLRSSMRRRQEHAAEPQRTGMAPRYCGGVIRLSWPHCGHARTARKLPSICSRSDGARSSMRTSPGCIVERASSSTWCSVSGTGVVATPSVSVLTWAPARLIADFKFGRFRFKVAASLPLAVSTERAARMRGKLDHHRHSFPRPGPSSGLIPEMELFPLRRAPQLTTALVPRPSVSYPPVPRRICRTACRT